MLSLYSDFTDLTRKVGIKIKKKNTFQKIFNFFEKPNNEMFNKCFKKFQNENNI